jgi:hypothetical protein
MLDVLKKIEKNIPTMLGETGVWKSLYIDYDYPNVERVYRDHGDYRINLHIIRPIPHGKKALYHPHPWPSAMKILHRSYKMNLGFGPYDGDDPDVVSRLVMSPGSAYEMVEKNCWHNVTPVKGNVASIMITGKPWWEGWSPNDEELSLGPLTDGRKEAILDLFKNFYEWQ